MVLGAQPSGYQGAEFEEVVRKPKNVTYQEENCYPEKESMVFWTQGLHFWNYPSLQVTSYMVMRRSLQVALLQALGEYQEWNA